METRRHNWLPYGMMSMFVAALLSCQPTVNPPAPPVLECPSEVNLGPCEVGTFGQGRFRIRNRGGSPLAIDNVRTDCQCLGLEQVSEEGGYTRLEQFSLQPGASKEVVVRVKAPGPVGRQIRNRIFFRTNDPSATNVEVVVVIPTTTGGLRATPSGVSFGVLAPGGQAAEQVVELFDTATPSRKVRSVTSTTPDHLSVAWLPPPGAPRDEKGGPTDGVCVGRVRIRAKTATAGSLDGNVLVQLDSDSRLPDAIPVTGRVASVVEITPSALLLPIAVGDGKYVYQATCLCRAYNGTPLELDLEFAPDDFRVVIEPTSEKSPVRRVTIAAPADRAARETTIRLRATLDGKTHVIHIPVNCW